MDNGMLTNRSTGRTTPVAPWGSEADKSLSEDEYKQRYRDVNSDTNDCNQTSVQYRDRESGYDRLARVSL